jgi:GTPase SAR1 family protein
MYCRDADAALVVFDVTSRSSFMNLDVWIRFLQNSAANVPMVIFGNKADLAENRQITTDEGRRAASERGFAYFEGSAKTGANVQIVFNALATDCAASACQRAPVDPLARPANPSGGESRSSCC